MTSDTEYDKSQRTTLVQFWQKLGYLLSADVPLAEALQAVMVELRDQELAPIVAKIKADVEKGWPLSRALEGLPSVFSPMTLAIARAGELKGQVAGAVTRLAQGLKDGAISVGRPAGKPEEAEEDQEATAAQEAHELAMQIIQEALDARASDIHVEPSKTQAVVRYRVDGVLRQERTLGRDQYELLVARVKTMAALDPAERVRVQDGRILTEIGGKECDLRVNLTPVMFGQSVCMRILDRSVVHLDLDRVGLTPDALDTLDRWGREPNGIVIVTGPTGSGKTTTLYCLLERIKRPELKVLTAENPVEYILDGIGQSEVRDHLGLTFGSLIRSQLRQDPDVIMVGEIRDTETANLCVQAAMTGHLVFTTLHTNSAPAALRRLTDMGLAPFLVNNTVIGVMAQRLCRRLCQECKEPHPATERELRTMGLDATQQITLYTPKGCNTCRGLGYRGRIPLVEAMDMNDALRDALDHRASAEELHGIAAEKGMTTMREYAMGQVQAGVTSLDEVNRATAGV